MDEQTGPIDSNEPGSKIIPESSPAYFATFLEAANSEADLACAAEDVI